MTASSTLSRSGSPARPAAPPPGRRRRWAKLLVVLLVVLVLAAAGWLVAFSSVLATRQVDVVGRHTLSAQDVRAAAQVPLGKPLVRQDLDGIAARVASLKPVRTVQAERSWPHGVTITVQERTAALAFRQSNGFLLVDSAGVGYLTVEALPTGVVLASANLTDVKLLTELSTVASALPPGLKSKLDHVQADTVDNITLVLKDGDNVSWGNADESELKSEVLLALLKRSARSYDVSAPRNPSLR